MLTTGASGPKSTPVKTIAADSAIKAVAAEGTIDLGPLWRMIKAEAEDLDITPDALARVICREWLDARKTRRAS